MDRRGVSTAQHSYRIAQQDLETSNRGVAQPGRVLRSGRRSRRFESSHPDQVNLVINILMSPLKKLSACDIEGLLLGIDCNVCRPSHQFIT